MAWNWKRSQAVHAVQLCYSRGINTRLGDTTQGTQGTEYRTRRVRALVHSATRREAVLCLAKSCGMLQRRDHAPGRAAATVGCIWRRQLVLGPPSSPKRNYMYMRIHALELRRYGRASFPKLPLAARIAARVQGGEDAVEGDVGDDLRHRLDDECRLERLVECRQQRTELLVFGLLLGARRRQRRVPASRHFPPGAICTRGRRFERAGGVKAARVWNGVRMDARVGDRGAP